MNHDNDSITSGSDTPISSDRILQYWFGDDLNDVQKIEQRYKIWFKGRAADDEYIRENFEPLLHEALAGNLSHWRQQPRSALAEIIVCDQFPRNIYRGTADAFCGDKHALRRAQELIDAGGDMELPMIQRMFVYLPLEHAEDRDVQQECVNMFEMLVADCPPQFDRLMQGALKSVVEHAEIVRKFGRFPHRNEILGRESSARELKYLETDGRRFGQGGSRR